MERLSKKEQLTLRYSKLKKKVLDWENAIYKTEGRKATKDDMKAAPKDVQESYRDLVKIRKYLENGCPETPRKDIGTPGKIFLGKHRQQLGRTDHSYLTTPAKVQPHKGSTKPRTVAPTLGLRSFGNSTLTVNPTTTTVESSSAPQQFTFKKLFSAIGELQNTVAQSKKSHKTVTVKDGDDKLVDRKVLVPSRFSLARKTDSNPTPVIEAPNSMDNSLEDEDYILENPIKNKPSNNESNAGSEDAITKPEIKSPVAKTKAGLRVSRQLDKGWLARLEEEEEENSRKELNNYSTSFSAESENTVSSDHGCPKSPVVEELKENISFSVGESSMDIDSDFTSESTLNLPSITLDNSDSGICVFNSEDVYQAVEEVLAETRQSNRSTVSDADESLHCNYSEDACLPPDSDFLNPTDKNAISNIIKSLSDSISDGEEASSGSCSNQNHNDINDYSRKRKSSCSFTPSPEKLAQKRKFFKSSRSERVAKFSLGSFKPPSPVKKVKRSSQDVSKSRATPTTIASSRNNGNSVMSKPMSEKPTLISNTEAVSKVGGNITSRDTPSPVQNSSRPKRTSNSKTHINYKEEDDQTEVKVTRQPGVVVDAFDEAPRPMTISIKRRVKRQPTKLDKKEMLESKIASGKVNENYVRIDTKRKVFVRGHKKISVTKLKRLDWKNKKSAAGKGKESFSKTFTCNKCGEKGHFAKFCLKDAAQDECPAEQDDSPFPTLEEAARMIWTNPSSNTKRVNIYSSSSSQSQDLATNSEESNLTACTAEPSENLCLKLVESVDPFFLDENAPTGADQEFEDDVIQEGLKAFGYQSFRPGQREAVCRVLNGLSTLLILSTGSGKSLCYQLPAYLYGKKYPGALTLCISPLVSLMEDQILGIPPFLNAACLHSNMTAKQKSIVLEKVKAKQLHILLVSPEAVCGGLFGLLKGNSDNLPIISFACIDEVHCVSQWSHNFRPSYLQLCKILREKLNVKTILGLTATATRPTAQSICEHLNVDPSTTIRGELIPNNLKLSVSRDVHKDEALINLLRGDRFRECDSIIIYCTRREECERIASFVRTQIQEIATKVIKTKSRSRLSGSCEAYHAGMTPRRRKNVQEGFMSGSIRIVVATVAFGMGIDKSDIRAVIHYNMPSAFESYVQEIGRAGRDGLPAHCHLFLDSAKRNDLSELKRHVYANSVDRPTVRKLLRKVFRPCKCDKIEQLKGNSQVSENESPKACPGHEVSFSIEQTVLDLDLPQENITTLLCYLELDEKRWIDMLPLTYETCKIQSYGGPKVLKAAASRSPPLAAAIALLKEKKKFRETDSHLEFNVIETAATLGWNSGIVKKELKNLEWAGSQFDASGNPTRFRKSGLMVEFSDLAYRVMSPGSMSDEEADKVLNTLHGRNLKQEQTQLYQLQRVYHALLSVSMPNINNLCDTYDEDKSDALKKFIHEYFNEDSMLTSLEFSGQDEIEVDSGKIEDLRRSIRHLIDSSGDTHFTTRAIAKIFQGISSPCFPADVWYRNRDFWRRYLDLDFHLICRIAAEEL